MDELIYVIAGKEDSLVNAHCSKLLDKLLEPSQRTTGLFDADAATVTVSEVLDELRTSPFLTDKRVVLVKGADKFISENRDLLEKYFDNPCPTGRLIFTVKTWDARMRLAKKLAKTGKLINAIQPKGRELSQRLIQYARDAHDKRLGRDAAWLLIEVAGDELPRLYSEIDKLALFAGGTAFQAVNTGRMPVPQAITTEHIELLTGHNRLFNAFTVIDAVIAGNIGIAVERLRAMFAQDKSAEFSVVGAFAYHFRRMFNAKVLLTQGVRAGEIANRFKIWSGKDKFFAQLRKLSLKQIGRYLQELAHTDYTIKTGQTTAPVAMEQFVLKLSAR